MMSIMCKPFAVSRIGMMIQFGFLGAEPDGEELRNLTEWLSTFAPGRHMVRRLIFKILSATRYRPETASPIIRE